MSELEDVPVARTEYRPAPEHGWLDKRGVAPVEKVVVWYGGFHPFEPTVEDDLGSPCKVCKPWGLGAHVHYPATEYLAPTSVFTVEYHDYEDTRFDSAFYSKATAVARAEALNRELWADYVKGMEQVRERWATALAANPLTDEDIAFLDAQLIAEAAREKGVRKAARAVRDAFKRQAEGDPREGLAYGEEQASVTFEDWTATTYSAVWRVSEVSIDDAREVSNGTTDG